MPPPFTDNPAKGVVRELWDTPVLKYLNTKYGVRYRYMGLPGVELIDVKLWKDMIDEVIAFEPPDDRSKDRRGAITTLRRNMKLIGIPGTAFYGSMEEVICMGRDYDGLPYTQNQVITLYNLDFCDEISSSILTREGNEKVMRFEAIRQLLRDQLECYQRTRGDSHFILMLTLRNQIYSKKIRKFLNSPLISEAKEFCEACQTVKPIPNEGLPLIGTHPWALKAYLFNWLCQNFANPNLSALFFPIVHYDGTPLRDGTESPMIHWMILCRFSHAEDQAPSFFPRPYLTNPSVLAEHKSSGSLIWKSQEGEEKPNTNTPDAVAWLTSHGGNFLNSLKFRASLGSPAKSPGKGAPRRRR